MSDTFQDVADKVAGALIAACNSRDEPMFMDDCVMLGILIEDEMQARGSDEFPVFESGGQHINQAMFTALMDIALMRESAVIHRLNDGDIIDAAKVVERCSQILYIAAEYTPYALPQHQRHFEAPLRHKYYSLLEEMTGHEKDTQHITLAEAAAFDAIGDAILGAFDNHPSMTAFAHEMNAARITRYAHALALEESIDKAHRTFGAKREPHVQKALGMMNTLATVPFAASDERLSESFRRVSSLCQVEEDYQKDPVLRAIGGFEHAVLCKLGVIRPVL